MATAPELRPYSKRQQLLQELLNDAELLLKNRLEVRHLMTRDPLVVPPTTTLEEMTLPAAAAAAATICWCAVGGASCSGSSATGTCTASPARPPSS